MTAVDEKLPITFVVWNNRGYREIADNMRLADTEVIWADVFQRELGQTYNPTTLVLFKGATQSACGGARALVPARPKNSRRGTRNLAFMNILACASGDQAEAAAR